MIGDAYVSAIRELRERATERARAEGVEAQRDRFARHLEDLLAANPGYWEQIDPVDRAVLRRPKGASS